MVILFLWTPFLFDAEINWDESSYIQVADGLTQGLLPYTQMWDAKPPLIYFVIAALLSLHRSVVTVRLGAMVCVLVSSFFTFKAAHQLSTNRFSWLAGLFVAVFSSMGPGYASFASEHLALAFLGPALYLLLRPPPRLPFLIGILISCACLVRLNLAYLAISVGFIILFTWPNKLINSLKYVLGGLLPIAFFVAVYAYHGALLNLYRGTVEVALGYAGSQTILGSRELESLLKLLEVGFYLDSFLVWTSLFAGLIIMIRMWPYTNKFTHQQFLVLAVAFFSIFYSMIKSGEVHPHYTLQILPIVAVLASVIASHLRPIRLLRNGFIFVALVGLIGPFCNKVLPQYLEIAHRYVNRQPIFWDTGYRIAAAINKHDPNGTTAYFMRYHIGYFLTKTLPVTRIVHPSDISKERFLDIIVGRPTSTLEELERILNKQPKFLVKDNELRYLKKHPKAVFLLEQTLSNKYVQIAKINETEIYMLP